MSYCDVGVKLLLVKVEACHMRASRPYDLGKNQKTPHPNEARRLSDVIDD